jgi:LacI family transcriptional regulator
VAVAGMDEIFAERRDGLAAALAAAGIGFSAGRDVHCFAGTAELAGAPLGDLARQYDTIFCVNDIVGTAVLAELARAGIPVPGRCQVTGFDDSPLRRLTRPLLTTIAMPVFELARRAGKRLVGEVIDGDPVAPLERLPGELLVGDSTRRPPDPS